MPSTYSRIPLRVSLVALAVLTVVPAQAQWLQTHEQFYLPARHNWTFRNVYPVADRLFNAFDYGHSILYERLYRNPDAPAAVLEEKEYRFITQRLLPNPPHVPLEEAAIEVAYVKLVPEAKLMFEWAHVLHRQIYDVLADERLTLEEKDEAVAEILRYYKSRPDLAFSSHPKSMELMEGLDYSLAFRERYPKFNGLIWAYHWLQVGLYEPLLTGRHADERQAGVTAAVARFWQMLEDPPESMPRVMPMTAAVAPTFSARYPEAAIIFDNLHSMHDVISDILASSVVPRRGKRAAILEAANRYRDDVSYVMSRSDWIEMSRMMGVHNMGGVSDGLMTPLPKPTAPVGATHETAMQHGEQGDHGEHDVHGDEGDDGDEVDELDDGDGDDHGHHGRHGEHDAQRETQESDDPSADVMDVLMELHDRMTAHPAIHRRMMEIIGEDAQIRQWMEETEAEGPARDMSAAQHREMMERHHAAVLEMSPSTRRAHTAQMIDLHRQMIDRIANDADVHDRMMQVMREIMADADPADREHLMRITPPEHLDMISPGTSPDDAPDNEPQR